MQNVTNIVEKPLNATSQKQNVIKKAHPQQSIIHQPKNSTDAIQSPQFSSFDSPTTSQSTSVYKQTVSDSGLRRAADMDEDELDEILSFGIVFLLLYRDTETNLQSEYGMWY